MGSAMAVWAVMGCQEKSGSWVQWPPLYLSWSHPWIIRQASSHPNWCAPSLPTPPTYNIFLLTGYVLIWFILQTLPCAIKPSWRPVQNDFFCHLVSPTCSFECFSDRFMCETCFSSYMGSFLLHSMWQGPDMWPGSTYTYQFSKAFLSVNTLHLCSSLWNGQAVTFRH